ncbi:hypothetical protein [Streptomyces minutiscleroticus]|uniref:Uncharacterized protein n=1 Tax=Streptomyces minutiscleroticus TaxID=68238 RepID=A0A918NJT4_9ACTN|nr:hypothetical protein [Streptomyces minutiscleroticus]GGX73282.1 hypothetical protein GCM10010358_29740 [Streptomyces minutiscleroticus]
MATDVGRETVTRSPATGWEQVRRRGESTVRTCVPAIADGSSEERSAGDPDWNVVRGED